MWHLALSVPAVARVLYFLVAVKGEVELSEQRNKRSNGPVDERTIPVTSSDKLIFASVTKQYHEWVFIFIPGCPSGQFPIR